MKRGAIFDMDGTLLDTEKYYRKAWLEVAKDFGKESKPELASAMSGIGIKDVPNILHRFYPDVNAEQYLHKVADFSEAEMEKEIALKSGAREILVYLKSQNILTAVASSAPKSIVERNLSRADIIQYFDKIVGGDQVENGKPSPDIFIKAAEELNLDAKDCYVFEDSFNGIRAAHGAGAFAIMIPDMSAPTNDIRQMCTIYESLNHALQAIKQGDI